MTNSRAKGARGEREAATVLRERLGVVAERSQQHSGKGGGPADLILYDGLGLPSSLSVEVKRVESLTVTQLVDFVRRARSEARSKPSVVMHRRNDESWLITLDSLDIVPVAREIVRLAGGA